MGTIFTNKKRQLVYNLRCRSVNDIKDNFHRLYGDEPAFPFLCPLQVDNQEHLLICQSLVTHLTSNNQNALQGVSYSHLFGTCPQQLYIFVYLWPS